MRATVVTGLLACVFISAAGGASASAKSSDVSESILLSNKIQETHPRVAMLTYKEVKQTEGTNIKPVETAPQPVVHTVASNESLSSIAAANASDWRRLFNKNEQLANPDIINVGDKITIPLADEQLPDRPLPEPPIIAQSAPTGYTGTNQSTVISNTVDATRFVSPRGALGGNTYTAGYCTWYAKSMRPDLPNNLGNADTWTYRASSQGIATGSTPRAGAIGQQGMHVVYVQSVNGDGTVNISEMNWKGLYVVSTRTVAASNFQYIY